MILPPATLGMAGGGQLGRMTVLAGRRLGYRFAVFEPPSRDGMASPAGRVADHEVRAGWDDERAVEAFARACTSVTYEFENIPVEFLERAARFVPVHPAPRVNHVAQHRRREKEWLRGSGFPTAPFVVVTDAAGLASAVASLGLPCVLKTAAFGYDGKGQRVLRAGDDPVAAWDAFVVANGATGDAGFAAVVEGFVDFIGEFSVTIARSTSGEAVVFPLAENVHRDGILDLTVCPARVDPRLAAEAVELGRSVAQAIGLVGVLTVELFLTRDGRWLVNEIAPRPHNSAHHTIESCTTSQFDLHVRAVAGLPLGVPALRSPAAMVNLLGDAWHATGADPSHPDAAWFAPRLLQAGAHLHLYDKGEPRPGRKMGHYTVLASTADEAIRMAESLRPVPRR